jgi:hypothetical protein
MKARHSNPHNTKKKKKHNTILGLCEVWKQHVPLGIQILPIYRATWKFQFLKGPEKSRFATGAGCYGSLWASWTTLSYRLEGSENIRKRCFMGPLIIPYNWIIAQTIRIWEQNSAIFNRNKCYCFPFLEKQSSYLLLNHSRGWILKHVTWVLLMAFIDH